MALEAEKQIKAGYTTVDDHHAPGPAEQHRRRLHQQQVRLHGTVLPGLAACATSLVAIYTAIQLINNGILDAAVVGGGGESLFPAHFIEFWALGALAGVSGLACPPEASSRPFDSTRDGFVLGEGGGIIVIERESVAKKRGARVYSYITGVGASNNDRGMVESVAETQQIALRLPVLRMPITARKWWTWWNATPPPPSRGTWRKSGPSRAFTPTADG